MKLLKCDLCNYEEQGETFAEWMNALKPHYAEAHAAVMNNKAGLTPAQQQEEMQEWMDKNKARFDAS